MKDTVIKGTGNSRWLKSAIEESTTWEQFRDLLRAGTLPIDLAGINMEGIDVLGNMLNKATLLQDFTAQLLGLDPADNPTVDDAFLNTFLTASGAGLVKIQVYETGTVTPISGVHILGVTDLLGNDLYADETGLAIGLATAETSTIKVDTAYIDLTGQTTFSGATPAQKVTEVTLYATRVSNTSGKVETFTASTQKMFTNKVRRVDVHCVGGGAGGSSGYGNYSFDDGYTSTTARGGYGGEQGKSVTRNFVSFSPNKLFDITIGNKGTGGAAVRNGHAGVVMNSGTPGGTSSCLGVTAAGGTINSKNLQGAVAEGSGQTTDAVTASSRTTYLFGTSALGIVPGGDGGGGQATCKYESYSGARSLGGSPNGGDGGTSSANSASAGANAKGPGGGGGGGGSNINTTNTGVGAAGGDGGNGIAYLRWWY